MAFDHASSRHPPTRLGPLGRDHHLGRRAGRLFSFFSSRVYLDGAIDGLGQRIAGASAGHLYAPLRCAAQLTLARAPSSTRAIFQTTRARDGTGGDRRLAPAPEHRRIRSVGRQHRRCGAATPVGAPRKPLRSLTGVPVPPPLHAALVAATRAPTSIALPISLGTGPDGRPRPAPGMPCPPRLRQLRKFGRFNRGVFPYVGSDQ